MPQRRTSGMALLVVTGALGLLGMFASLFATMSRLERQASAQRLWEAKATLLARSGLEDALARLASGQDPAYGGEDWNLDRVLGSGREEAGSEVYGKNRLDVDACPVRHAVRPSFFRSITGDPRTVPVDGRLRGYSGRFGNETEHYALKVETGGFYVNGGDPAAPPGEGYNAVLRRMLGTLAEALDREDDLDDGIPTDEAFGRALIDFRPSSGWSSLEEIRKLAEQTGTLERVLPLLPYLTTSAWIDRKVIRPNAHPGMAGVGYSSWADLKMAHETYPSLPGTREPDFERIPVLPSGRIVGRAPVDLAWARTRKPVLIALLAGLRGVYLDEAAARSIDSGDFIGRALSEGISLAWGDPTDDCRTAADWILAATGTIETWDQWDAFCDTVPFTGTTDQRQVKRDLLKANFNPNSRLNKFGPNPSFWKRVDKSDLLVYSTEFSLLPRAEARRLECVGRVLGAEGRPLAVRVLGASLAPAGRLTLTTQKEFVCEELGDPRMAGDESQPRLPGQDPFLSRNRGTGKTWGHALSPAVLGDAGASLQTHPEPCVDAGSGLSIRAADYDGSVQLATVETPADGMYSVTTPTRDMKLLARFTRDLDLDVSDAAPGRPLGDPRWRNQPDVRQVTHSAGGIPDLSQLGNGLWDPARPNTLYPDGAYSEKDRAITYLDRGNANGFQGVISFWIKTNYALPPPAASRGHPYVAWTNYVDGLAHRASLSQFFYLGDYSLSSVLCQFENTQSANDGNREHRFERNSLLKPHQWSLVTMFYDFRSDTNHDSGELLVNAGSSSADRGSQDVYGAPSNDALAAMDITQSDMFGPHRLRLGKNRPELELAAVSGTGSGADATFDEVALYDFGGAGPGGIPKASLESLAAPGILALRRFREGRYYKESAYVGLVATGGANRAGEYFSPTLRLEGPGCIRALRWTQVVPRGLRAPLPHGGQAGVDGDPGEDGRILLELADASGADYLEDASGNPIDQAFRNPASSIVGRKVDAPFRIHAVFQPNLEVPPGGGLEDVPILDPLALDDLAVLWEPPGGPRILAWD